MVSDVTANDDFTTPTVVGVFFFVLFFFPYGFSITTGLQLGGTEVLRRFRNCLNKDCPHHQGRRVV